MISLESPQKTARLAGFYYVLVVIGSVLYMEVIPRSIFIWDDPTSTLENLLFNQTLFRIGIIVGIGVHISFILLPLTLYTLLNPVNKNHAILMVVFALISVPNSYTLLLDQVNLLKIIQEYPFNSPVEAERLADSVSSFYTSLYNGFFLSQVFWGLWLFPFGLLVYKSGFLPKALGVFLMLGCLTYLIDVIGGTIFENYYDYVNTSILIIPAAIGEIGICIWLITVGIKQENRS